MKAATSERRDDIAGRVSPSRLRGAVAAARCGCLADGLVGQDVDGDARRFAHQPIDDRAVAKLEPSGAGRLADDELGRAHVVEERLEAFDDVRSRDACDVGPELGGELHVLRDLLPLLGREAERARRFDIDRGPRRALRVGQALGGADKGFGARQLADRNHDPFARRPIAGERMRPHIIEHLRVDGLRRAAKRQLAKSRQVRLGEEVAERPGRLLGDVDLALLQALDQLVGRDIDDLDLGFLDDAVRHRLAHPDLREGCDDIVEAFDVLDVQGREDIDAGRKQLLDVLPALGVAAAGRVGVGELVDQRELRLPRLGSRRRPSPTELRP